MPISISHEVKYTIPHTKLQFNHKEHTIHENSKYLRHKF